VREDKAMKKLIALLLCISMLTLPAAAFTFEEVDTDQAFSDEVKQAEAVSDWALEEVKAADKLGLIVPSCATYMTGSITREQFAELSVNLVEVVTGKALAPADVSTFTDCTNEAVRKAAAAGIVNGVADHLFDPDSGLTREQLATMLYRAWNHIGSAAPAAGLEGYTDAGKVASWAADAVGALAAADIMRGTSDTTLDPQGPCTIEQSILLVYRLYQRITAPVTQTPENPGNVEIPSDAITIDMRTSDVGHRAPKEGDTIIRPDGTSVVLKRDEFTGVLGYGQNVGPYLGTEGKVSGHIITTNEWIVSGLEDGTWTDPLAGGWYMPAGVKGQEYTYHWSGEWTRIRRLTRPERDGKDGEIDSTGLWKFYSEDSSWIWLGPDC